MNAGSTQIRDKQKESWNKFSPGWKKWDNLAMKFIKVHGDEIISHLNPSGSDLVLDIASGTGEPGLTIASMLSEGKVVLSDLSNGMLKVAAEKAQAKGLQNTVTVIADACALPFPDNSFDLISCRLGFMFFPELALAAKEMARVLKPGGRIAITVWGAPEKNFWVTCMVQNIKKYIEMPIPPQAAPGMFRCAQSGLIADLFRQAGFKNIEEEELFGKIACESAIEYWDFMTDIAVPFVVALNTADEETVEKIKIDVVNSINAKYPNETTLDTSGIIIYGEK